MKKVINCYKEFNPLIQRKLKEVSVEEGFEIATELFQILNERKDGIGLAANQVGYDAAVAVVNVKEPLILINPVIKEQWDEIDYYEGCGMGTVVACVDEKGHRKKNPKHTNAVPLMSAGGCGGRYGINKRIKIEKSS